MKKLLFAIDTFLMSKPVHYILVIAVAIALIVGIMPGRFIGEGLLLYLALRMWEDIWAYYHGQRNKIKPRTLTGRITSNVSNIKWVGQYKPTLFLYFTQGIPHAEDVLLIQMSGQDEIIAAMAAKYVDSDVPGEVAYTQGQSGLFSFSRDKHQTFNIIIAQFMQQLGQEKAIDNYRIEVFINHDLYEQLSPRMQSAFRIMTTDGHLHIEGHPSSQSAESPSSSSSSTSGN